MHANLSGINIGGRRREHPRLPPPPLLLPQINFTYSVINILTCLRVNRGCSLEFPGLAGALPLPLPLWLDDPSPDIRAFRRCILFSSWLNCSTTLSTKIKHHSFYACSSKYYINLNRSLISNNRSVFETVPVYPQLQVLFCICCILFIAHLVCHTYRHTRIANCLHAPYAFIRFTL